MHEFSLAQEIYRVCEASLADRPGARIRAVRLAVGELSAAEPELLRFAWSAVVAEGPHAGAELKIEWRRARQYCPQCKREQERARGGWLRICPECGGFLLVEGGRELDVLDVTLAVGDDSPEDESSGVAQRRQGSAADEKGETR